MLEIERARAALSWLRVTPLHPQWLSSRHESSDLRRWGAQASGTVLDLGCGRRRIEAHLARDTVYVAMDYLATSSSLYGVEPDVFGDAASLPFQSECFETVLMLEVMEHLPNPAAALSEVMRVLKPGGSLIVSAPFLYPLHDAPYDFQRWTLPGLRALMSATGFEISEMKSRGSPLETAALLANIGVAKLLLDAVAKTRILWVLPLLLAIATILPLNLLGAVFANWHRDREFMPHALSAVLIKPR